MYEDGLSGDKSEVDFRLDLELPMVRSGATLSSKLTECVLMLGILVLFPAPHFTTTITTTIAEALGEQNNLAAPEGPFKKPDVREDHPQSWQVSKKKKGRRSKDMIMHQHFHSFFLFQLK